MIRVLFVCLGNICRSPMAEAVFSAMVERAGLADRIAVDSVGLGRWHVGEPAHPGTQRVLRQRGIDYVGCARQVCEADLRTADYVVAMDEQNLEGLRALDPGGELRDKVHRLLDFAPPGGPPDVPDPYYSGGFEHVYELVEAGCGGLLERIRADHDL